MSTSDQDPVADAMRQSIVAHKDTYRMMLFEKRRDLGAPARDAESVQLTTQLSGWFKELEDEGRLENRTVCATLAFSTEPDTDPVLVELVERGYQVFVPIALEDSEMVWVSWHPGIETAPSEFGSMHEPVGPRLSAAELPAIDVVLVPALAVDQGGYRMGKGGGYYDKFLADLAETGQDPLLVTPLFNHEFLSDCSRIPREPHDMPVQAVATAQGIRWVRNARPTAR